ncbi:hypothetical protein HDV06_006740 [Boothiomyces sp. JEL0866]|nr:hypothetical protein HDV06_006740 [Boothiomyces sp. JEL0866]
MTKGGVYGKEGGDTNFRQTWDKDEYRQKAKEREQQLKKRKQPDEEENLNLGAAQTIDEQLLNVTVNKTAVVTAAEELKGPGFHCRVCDETFKDNLSFLDHLTSPSHLKKTGQSTHVERSTVEQVRKRLAARKVKPVVVDPKDLIEQRIKEAAELKRKKKEEKKNAKKEEVYEDQSIAEIMGFGSFGSTKK